MDNFRLTLHRSNYFRGKIFNSAKGILNYIIIVLELFADSEIY